MKPCTSATCDLQPWNSTWSRPAPLETTWKLIPYQDLSEYNINSCDLSIASHGTFIRESGTFSFLPILQQSGWWTSNESGGLTMTQHATSGGKKTRTTRTLNRHTFTRRAPTSEASQNMASCVLQTTSARSQLNALNETLRLALFKLLHSRIYLMICCWKRDGSYLKDNRDH